MTEGVGGEVRWCASEGVGGKVCGCVDVWVGSRQVEARASK